MTRIGAGSWENAKEKAISGNAVQQKMQVTESAGFRSAPAAPPPPPAPSTCFENNLSMAIHNPNIMHNKNNRLACS